MIEKQAKELANIIVKQTNEFYEKHMNAITNTFIPTEEGLQALQEILQKGLNLHNFIIKHSLYTDQPNIQASLIEEEKYVKLLQINDTNSKKLNLENAIQIWLQLLIVITLTSNNILNYYENKEN